VNRKAKTEDIEDIFRIVNAAYQVELEEAGGNFKSANRYK